MDITPIDKLLADARETYGVFGRSKQALALVDRALALDAQSVEALNLKAAILFDIDRDDEAEEFHRKALEIEPCSVEALYGLASLANDRYDYVQGLESAERGFACIPLDPHQEFRENEDFRQRLIAQLFNEKAFALWYMGKKDEATALLTEEGPRTCPMEVETFEEELEWLEHHPESPEEE